MPFLVGWLFLAIPRLCYVLFVLYVPHVAHVPRYPYTPPGSRHAEERHPRLLAELEQLDGDIICLQVL